MENYLFNFCKNVNFEECIDTLKKKLKRSNQIEEYDFIYETYFIDKKIHNCHDIIPNLERIIYLIVLTYYYFDFIHPDNQRYINTLPIDFFIWFMEKKDYSMNNLIQICILFSDLSSESDLNVFKNVDPRNFKENWHFDDPLHFLEFEYGNKYGNDYYNSDYDEDEQIEMIKEDKTLSETFLFNEISDKFITPWDKEKDKIFGRLNIPPFSFGSSEIIIFPPNVCIGIYVLIGDKAGFLSFKIMSDLLSDKSFIRFPMSLKFINSLTGPHNNRFNTPKKLFTHDVEHFNNAVLTINSIDFDSVVDVDPKKSSNSLDQRIFHIFVYIILFESTNGDDSVSNFFDSIGDCGNRYILRNIITCERSFIARFKLEEQLKFSDTIKNSVVKNIGYLLDGYDHKYVVKYILDSSDIDNNELIAEYLFKVEDGQNLIIMIEPFLNTWVEKYC